jgi:hypothetical protein
MTTENYSNFFDEIGVSNEMSLEGGGQDIAVEDAELAAPAPDVLNDLLLDLDKQNRSKDNSIQSLSSRLKSLENENAYIKSNMESVRGRLSEKDQELAAYRNAIEANETQKFENYSNSLDEQEERVIDDLKRAKAEGDIDWEVDLSKTLSDISADRAAFNLYRSQKERARAETEYEPLVADADPFAYEASCQAQAYQEPQQEYSEEFCNWLSRNSWADPSSGSYSKRMAEEAQDTIEDFNKTLLYNDLQSQIGTEDYYDHIDSILSAKFGGLKKGQKSNVESVSRGTNFEDLSTSYGKKSDGYSLSSEEYDFARKLARGMPTRPGQTEEDVLKLYADSKKRYK